MSLYLLRNSKKKFKNIFFNFISNNFIYFSFEIHNVEKKKIILILNNNDWKQRKNNFLMKFKIIEQRLLKNNENTKTKIINNYSTHSLP